MSFSTLPNAASGAAHASPPRAAEAVHTVGVVSVGVLAPGLPCWTQAAKTFRGGGFGQRPLAPASLDMLPRNERRRATLAIRMALESSQQAIDSAGVDAARMRTVFACSGGDTETLDRICTALAMPGRPVSPAQFHKSVHNAPAGYWSIAFGSHAPSTSVCAYDASFGAGLLEAFTLAIEAAGPVLLVAYDVPPPDALYPFRPLTAPFAVAMVLDRASSHTQGLPGARGLRLGLALESRPEGASAGRTSCHGRASAATESLMPDAQLENLRVGNPAARSLPLLERLAAARPGRVFLPYLDGALLAVTLESAV